MTTPKNAREIIKNLTTGGYLSGSSHTDNAVNQALSDLAEWVLAEKKNCFLKKPYNKGWNSVLDHLTTKLKES